MASYKILRPAFLSDYHESSMPQQRMFVGHMDDPCPILVECNSGITIWNSPDTEFVYCGVVYVISSNDMAQIPTVKRWLLDCLYLDDDERVKAISNKLEWQFVFTIYEYSKMCHYSKIISPFWQVSRRLQVIMNLLLTCNRKELFVQIFNKLQELDQELQQKLTVISNRKSKNLSQSDCEIFQVCDFIGRHYIYCLEQIKK